MSSVSKTPKSKFQVKITFSNDAVKNEVKYYTPAEFDSAKMGWQMNDLVKQVEFTAENGTVTKAKK
jgi:hypothetical protein